jgi:hypothetical protein
MGVNTGEELMNAPGLFWLPLLLWGLIIYAVVEVVWK